MGELGRDTTPPRKFAGDVVKRGVVNRRRYLASVAGAVSGDASASGACAASLASAALTCACNSGGKLSKSIRRAFQFHVDFICSSVKPRPESEHSWNAASVKSAPVKSRSTN